MKILPIIVIILALIMITTIIYVNFREPHPESIPHQKSQTNPLIENQNQQPTSNNNEQNIQTSESSTGLAGGGGGGGGSGGSSSTSGETCTKHISYSLSNFQESISCDDSSCTSATLTCGVILKNLDYEISGNFGVSFKAKNTNTQEITQQLVEENNIEPRQEVFFQTNISLSSENFECQTTTAFTPTKPC